MTKTKWNLVIYATSSSKVSPVFIIVDEPWDTIILETAARVGDEVADGIAIGGGGIRPGMMCAGNWCIIWNRSTSEEREEYAEEFDYDFDFGYKPGEF